MQLGYPMLQKPLRGAGLDLTSPFARNLGGAYLLNENSGTSVYDLTGNTPLNFVGTPTWSSGPHGIALASNTGNSGKTGAYGIIPAWLQSSTPQFTLAMGVRRLTTVAQYQGIGGLLNDTSNSSTGNIQVTWNNSSGQIICFYRGSTQSVTGSTLDTNDHVIAAAINGNSGCVLYADGVQVGSNGTAAATGWTATSCVSLLCNPGTTNQSGPTQLYWFYWWSRTLSAAEILSISQNPYQLIRPQIPPAWLYNSTLTVRPRSISVPLVPQPRRTYKVAQTQSPLISGFPRGPLILRLPPALRPPVPRTAKTRYAPVTNPASRPGIFTARVPVSPGRGRPVQARTLYTGNGPTPTPTPTSTFLNLDPYSVVPLGNDADPLAVDPGGVVLVGNDLDPMAVDAALVVLLGSDSDPMNVDPSGVIWIN